MQNNRTKWKQLLAKVKEFRDNVNEENVDEVEKELDKLNKHFLQRERLYSNSNARKLWIVESGRTKDNILEDIVYSVSPGSLQNHFRGGLDPKNIMWWGFDEGMAYKLAHEELNRLKEGK